MNGKMNGKRLFAASYGHFSIDFLNSSIPLILTAVAANFHLDVSQIGLAAMIYTFAASLTQPFFGMLVDRLRGRWVAGVGLLWTMTFYALAPFMPNYMTLVACLSLGALGSGAFHPAGMTNSTMAGGHKPTTATSLFFVAGQTGLAVGPTVAGLLLQNFGLTALPYMALLMTPAALYALWQMRQPYEDVLHMSHAAKGGTAEKKPVEKNVAVPAASPSRTGSKMLFVVLAFVLLITFRSTTQQGFNTLLPKFFADQGYSPAGYGLMLSVLGFAGATGTFLGGWLGDRFNRRMVILTSMTLAAFFSYGMLHTGGLAYAVVALGAGIMMNIPHSILIIMAQRLIPARKAMIGGAVLGLMFASGAATTAVGSWIADYAGLPAVLSVFALLPLGAGLCALLLPSTRGNEALVEIKPTPEAAPSAAGD
jgi:FSR family fosmidomycin resistance protein-like MFS transporter